MKDNKMIIKSFFDSFIEIKNYDTYNLYFKQDFLLALLYYRPEMYLYLCFILSQMNKEHSLVIVNEFINKKPNNWWYKLYLKEDYLNIREKAMEEFVNIVKLC